MKKLLIAVLVLFLLAGIATVGVGYYVYRQVRSTVTQLAELGQVPEIEAGVRRRGAFVPPANDELTESQVARFVRVQARVRERLGAGVAEFERKYQAVLEKEQGSLADLPAVVAGYRDLAALWLDAKRAQVAALNEAEFSLEEYRWVRDQVYRALGQPFVDLDIAQLIEGARDGAAVTAGSLRGAFEAAGPKSNRRLIESVKRQLEENLPLASFGL